MNVQDAINNKTKNQLYVSLSARPGTTGTKFYTELFKHYNINAEYVACSCVNIKNDLELVKKYCKGASISMPFKQQIHEYVDDWELPSTGIANTLTVYHDQLIAYNCDLMGLTTLINPGNKLVNILGDGAMADNIKCLCRNYNQYSRRLGNWDQRHNPCDILINTTSVGMNLDECPVNEINADTVIDCVIGKTKFVHMAEQKGLNVITGADIYVAQFMHQFKVYTGITPNIDIVKKVKEHVFV